MATRKGKKPIDPAPSLSNTQVDVSTRLGVVNPTTTTGIKMFDELLGGGLRAGLHLVVAGPPGVGKTAFALMVAYMAARARAGVLFTSVGLDDTEILARLAARALHREYENVEETYGTIWAGQAMTDDALRGPINGCINGVFSKVGGMLHLHNAEPMESTAQLVAKTRHLFARTDRVVTVVDGVEGFSASGGGSSRKAELANASYDGRISQTAFELLKLAQEGSTVITTCQQENLRLVVPAATVATEMRVVHDPVARRRVRQKVAVASRPVDLSLVKNRFGPTASLPLSYVAAASVFEERLPPSA